MAIHAMVRRFGTAALATFLLAAGLVVGAVGQPSTAAAVEVSDPSGGAARVGGPHDLLVSLDGGGAVTVEVRYSRDGGIDPTDVAASVLEAAEGSGRFDRLTLTPSTDAVVATTGTATSATGELRLRSILTRVGSYQLAVTVRRDGAVVAETTATVEVASAWQRAGGIPSATEIIAATPDGMTLLATAGSGIDVWDIENTESPTLIGNVNTGGSVVSVDSTKDGRYALVATLNPWLSVVDLTTVTEVRRIEIIEGADSVKVSPDGAYAVVAIEGESEQVQGRVVIIDLDGEPAAWTVREVEFDPTDPALESPEDIQPETVDVNADNLAAMSLQENNAMAIVDVAAGTVVDIWSTGYVTRLGDDTADGLYRPVEELTRAREVDTASWTPDGEYLVTSDEGETRGTEGWSIFSKTGEVVYEGGAEVERRLAVAANYEDNETLQWEGNDVATYGEETFAFIGAERSSALAVYEISDPAHPRFVQILPVGRWRQLRAEPEGIAAIPGRDLVAVASEEDEISDIYRRVSEVDPAEVDEAPVESLDVVFDGVTGLYPDGAAGNGRFVAGDIGREGHVLLLNDWGSTLTVDKAIPIVFDGVPYQGPVESAVPDGAGGYWVGLADLRNGDNDDIESDAEVVRIDAAGTVVDQVDLAPDRAPVSGLTSTDGGVTLVALAGRELYRFPAADPDQLQRFTVQPDNATHALLPLPDGDVGFLTWDREVTSLQRADMDAASSGFLPITEVAVLDTWDPRGAHRPGGGHVVGNDLTWTKSDAGPLAFRAADVLPDAGTPATVTLTAPTAPVTVEAGATIDVGFDADTAGGYSVQLRAADGADDAWIGLEGGLGTASGAGAQTARPFVPIRDGVYDLRVVQLTASGELASSAVLQDGVVVDTPTAAVQLTRPTAAEPITVLPNQDWVAQFTTTEPGTYELQTRRDGDAAWTTVGSGQVRAFSDETWPVEVIVRAVGTLEEFDGSYDVRVRFLSGGVEEVVAVQAGALVIDTPPPATIELLPPAGGTFPLTAYAGGRPTVAVRVDQGTGQTQLYARPVGSGDDAWVGLPWERLSEEGFRFNAPVEDGAYDLRASFTNVVGLVSHDVELGALLVSTPGPVARLLSPHTLAPVTDRGYTYLQASLFATQNGPGEMFARRAGGPADAWISLGTFFVPEGQSRQDFIRHTLPDGTYDLRLDFANAQGTKVSDVEPAALVVESTGRDPELLFPSTERPWAARPGDTLRAELRMYGAGEALVELRPAGSGEDAWGSGGVGESGSSTGEFTEAEARVPLRGPGTFDVRLSVTDLDTGEVFTEVHPAALVVAVEPPLRLDLDNDQDDLVTGRQLSRRAGDPIEAGVQTSASALVQLQLAPTGTDDWTGIGTATTAFPRATLTAMAPTTDGVYDLRAVALDASGAVTEVSPRETGVIVVGTPPGARTIGAPVVISELNPHGFPTGTGGFEFRTAYVELQNVSDEPVDIGGWSLTSCRSGWASMPDIPPHTVLQPGERYLIGGTTEQEIADRYGMPLSDNRSNRNVGEMSTNPGLRLLDDSGVYVDGISTNPSGGTTARADQCREARIVAAPPPAAAGQPQLALHRVADTGDNAVDFELAPMSPEASFPGPAVNILSPTSEEAAIVPSGDDLTVRVDVDPTVQGVPDAVTADVAVYLQGEGGLVPLGTTSTSGAGEVAVTGAAPDPGTYAVVVTATSLYGVGLDETGLAVVVTEPPACPDPDERATVVIGTVDSGVPNRTTANGCTINDLIRDDQPWSDQGSFTRHVREVADQLVADGAITVRERGELTRAATTSGIGRPGGRRR